MSLKKIMKKTVITLLVLSPLIAILHLYCSIPNQITLASGGSYTYKLQPFTTLSSQKNKSLVETSASTNELIKISGNEAIINANKAGNYTLSLNLFDKLPLKKVDVTVNPEYYVIPSGRPIGVKLYTEGILVVGVSYVTNENGENTFPAKDADIREGDRILCINGIKISSIEEMSECINSSSGSLTLSIERDGTITEKRIKAIKNKNEASFKLGIWVRDTAAGVGTMTFYDPATNKFASLGHAITDVDTGNILKVSRGSIISCKIVSVTQGKRGTPGELIGSFTNENLGEIELNSPLGVYGTMENAETISNKDKVAVATRFQTKEGKAFILSDVDGNGVMQYEIEIQKISKDNSKDNKGITFKVTDSSLLSKTGGIVQGMSGSPIIQNNMLVGAVTHVFVNDPTKGYGIFAENMIDKIYELN